MTWDDVALKYGTDKASSHHGYMAHYELLLADPPVVLERLLEIGVAGGRSLRTWAELLPQTLIVGVDNDPECSTLQTPRQRVVIADAAHPAEMAAVHTLYGPFDVIIDDGSHDHDDVRMAFEELYPRLAPGGLYFIEDLTDVDFITDFTARWGGKILAGTGDVPGRLIAIAR